MREFAQVQKWTIVHEYIDRATLQELGREIPIHFVDPDGYNARVEEYEKSFETALACYSLRLTVKESRSTAVSKRG